jgi:hypothetical protein
MVLGLASERPKCNTLPSSISSFTVMVSRLKYDFYQDKLVSISFVFPSISYIQIREASSVDLPHRAKDAHQEHQEIVEALAQRDGDRAERLMRKHNRNGRINLIRRLRAEGVERENVSLRSILRSKRSPSRMRVKSK